MSDREKCSVCACLLSAGGHCRTESCPRFEAEPDMPHEDSEQDALDEARREITRLKTLVKSVEWAAGHEEPECPWCGAEHATPHEHPCPAFESIGVVR